MTSGITPITTASGKGADHERCWQAAATRARAVRAARHRSQGVDQPGTEALGEAGKLGAELYGLIYQKNARIRDHRLADKLAEMVACVQTAEHYLLMLGSVVGEPPRRTTADNP